MMSINDVGRPLDAGTPDLLGATPCADGVNEPDLGENSHSLAFELSNPSDPAIDEHLHVLLNAYWEPLEFELPELPEGRRRARLVDTGRPAPEDFTDPPDLLSGAEGTYETQPRSSVILVERNITPRKNGA